MRCKKCGGDLVANGSMLKCPYCRSEYNERDLLFEAKPSGSVGKDSGRNVFEANRAGVLEIVCQGAGGSWSGSGYIISRDGYAVTNAHVAAEKNGSACRNMKVRVCDCVVDAQVVALADDQAGSGAGPDLAMIKLQQMPHGAVPLAFERFENVHIGEQAFVIGNSLGDGLCITSGIVSDKSRVLNGKRLLMTDCAINGGNSGGPIFNAQGRVIGTICASRIKSDGSDTEGMNYAVPCDIVQAFAEAVLQRVRRSLR